MRTKIRIIQPSIRVLVQALVGDVARLLIELRRQSVVLLRVLGGLELQSRKVALLGFELLDALLEGCNILGPGGFGLWSRINSC
jgi:hypothetical protein